MQLRGEQLSGHLERSLLPAYLLWGDDPLLVIEAADAVRAAARRQGFDERKVLTVLPGFDWGELQQAAGNLSLFGSRTLIDLRLPTGKPGRDGSAALIAYSARPNPDCLLLVTASELDWRDEKAAWISALTDAGAALKLRAPGAAELPGWIAGRLRRQEQSAARAALEFIAERVEGNLLAAHQEIIKLGLIYPPGQLGLEEVRAAVLNVARFDLDGLRGALLAGDLPRLTRSLDGLRHEGEALPLVLWAFGEEVRALAQVRRGQAGGQALDQLLRAARVFGPRQTAFKKALGRISLPQIEAALRELAAIDRLIKGLASGNPWNAFLRLGVSLALAR